MMMVMIHLLKHLCVHLRLGDHLLLLLAGDLELGQFGVVRRLFPLQCPQLLFVHIRLVESQYSLLRQKVEVLEYAVKLDIEGAQLSINKLRIINNTWKQKRKYEIQWKH